MCAKTVVSPPLDRITVPLRITTWNVNSVRLRLRGLARLAREVSPDVICLQETKVANQHFPTGAISRLGYAHHALHGQPGYHGVAVVSRQPIEAAWPLDWCGKADCRHLQVRLGGGLEVHCVYVPSGGGEPDPSTNEKFAHKLDFLAALTAWFAGPGRARGPVVLVGDLNVAPLETDVWNHRALLEVVSHTPVEVRALGDLQAAGPWVDAVRHLIPPAERLYSWWSHRARDWSASDRGRRLDHVWISLDLVPQLTRAAVLRAARGWPEPSDHVPVTIDLDV